MASQTEQLKLRSKRFAVRVVNLFQALPRKDEARVIGRQLLRSATSVGANYRAVCRARSPKEFLSKIGVVVEEADETVFWLELLAECQIVPSTRLQSLTREAEELLAIFAASQRTAKHGRRRQDQVASAQSSMIQSSMTQSGKRP
jgi:four helix bundle protein